ncbi:MAG: hypothetical protein EPO65_05925 [Dehalococcoidia bacterium]|nr:MAG: hypothetical protein EPO65_05925 [Dehalococcoidia bacterium]
MQAPYSLGGLSTLAICGWTERTPDLLRALEARGVLPVAIGDRSATALAAAATALRGHPATPARYQHPREMLRRGRGDAVLLDMTDAAAEVAAAAQRGTLILATGDAIEPDTLDMLARCASSATVLRPLFWLAPVVAIVDAAHNLDRLRQIHLTVEDDRPALDIAGDLLTLASRIAGVPVEKVTATAYGPDRGETASIVTEVAFVGGASALLAARNVIGTRVEAELVARGVTVRAIGDSHGGSLTLTTGGRTEVTRLTAGDLTDLVIGDAIDELASGGVDTDVLFTEASLLRALQTSLGAPSAPGVRRPQWTVLAGGGQHTTPRRGHLHLVGV